MSNQLFVFTYNSQEAFDVSKQEGLLGFSTENTGTVGSLERILPGDLILLRDSRVRNGLSFFGLLEATDKISVVSSDAPLVWLEERKANKVIFTRRLPVKFIRSISRIIPIEEVLNWKWKRRYPPYNEYDWVGYTRLFAGNFLDEVQRGVLFIALEIDKPDSSTPLANDIEIGDNLPERVLTTTYRVLRDTVLARRIKEIHNYVCQVCGADPIRLPNGRFYAEAHHLIPLGKHGGLDVEGNIICVCPSCHVKLDYGVIALEFENLRTVSTHLIKEDFIKYHNREIYNKNPS